MNTFLRASAVCISTLFAAAAWAADGVAFLTNLKGEVSLDGSARPALMSELAKGQKLTLHSDATASVMFIQSGKEFALKGPGEYVVNAADLSAAKGAKPGERQTEWRTSQQALVKVSQSSAASVRMRSIAPAKADEPAKLQFPTAGAIATLQPTFRWAAAQPGQEITVAIASQRDKPVHKTKVSGDSFRMPYKLKPDTEYVWAISGTAGEFGSGAFKTLGAEAIAQAEKRKPSAKADFTDRLMHAVMLNDLGATQEAQEAWAKLAAERTDLPELAALAKAK
jgi:hypothetical protein